jgi:gliding motility-associated-like protein
LEVAFTDTSTNTSGFVTYDWHFGNAGSSSAPSPTITFNKEGTYPVSLQVTSDGDCRSFVERTDYIRVYDSPTSNFTANPLETVLEQATIQFTNSSVSTDTLTYNWDFNDGTTSDNTNPSHTYTETGSYNVLLTVVTDNGCEDTYSTEITVHPDFAVFIPNAFTPNGDGLNDVFEVKGVGVKTYQLQIYSRWGEQLYESNNFENKWDAANVPAGTYVYVIHATTLLDKQIEEKGTVTVIK